MGDGESAVPTLYKYMNRATSRAVLENRTLRWTTPGTLNDPYELQFELIFEFDHDAVKAAALPKMWEAFYGEEPVPVGNEFGEFIRKVRGSFPKLTREQFNQHFGEGLDESLSGVERILPEIKADLAALAARTKLLCLTEAPENTLMWSHYAEHHRGVVLGFRDVPELDSPYKLARPIEYLDDMPSLLNEDLLADMAAGRTSMKAEPFVRKMIYTKSSAWAYEREWRINTGYGRNREASYEDVQFNALELCVVILGCQMPEDDRAAFVELTRRLYPHATISQVRMAGNRYQLEIEPLALPE